MIDLNKPWCERGQLPRKSHGPLLPWRCWILIHGSTLRNGEVGFYWQSLPKCVFFFFLPSLHSRVYPEWFNYNFPCVRQIKEESRSVGPSTWFISWTDCSSPNPRAAAAAAARGSPKDARGRGRSSTWHGNTRPSPDRETPRNLENTPKLSRYHRGPMNFYTERSPSPFRKNP